MRYNVNNMEQIMESKNNIYKLPFLLRVIPFSILLLLFIFVIICFFVGIFSIETFFFAGILCIFNIFIYGIDFNIQYELSDNEIIIKKPFLKKKLYLINDIKVITFSKFLWLSCYNLYFGKKYIDIWIFGKKMLIGINEYFEKIYISVCNRNIEKIRTSGLKIKNLIFYEEMMEIINKKKYNYSDIKEIKLYNNGIFEKCLIITNDNKDIQVSSKINGLMEYLNGIKEISIINKNRQNI
jgi:hypothetical protein